MNQAPRPTPHAYRPKVLHAFPWDFVTGGAERFIHDMCDRTADRFENYVLAPSFDSRFRFDGLARLHVMERTRSNAIRQLLETIDPDILIHHAPFRASYYQFGAFVPKSGKVIGVSHIDVLGTPGHERCEWVQPRFLITLFPIKHKPQTWESIEFATMDLGVDLDRFRPMTHVEKEKLRAIMVSRVDKHKTPEGFVRALKKWDPGRWEIDIYGKAHYDHGRHIAKELEKLPFVNLKGLVDPEKMHEVYPQYDAFLLTTLPGTEAGSYATCEAMACGLPVVSRELAPLRRVTRNSAIFAQYDRDILGGLDLLEMTMIRNSMGASLRNVAEQHHDINKQTELFVSLVERALEN